MLRAPFAPGLVWDKLGPSAAPLGRTGGAKHPFDVQHAVLFEGTLEGKWPRPDPAKMPRYVKPGSCSSAGRFRLIRQEEPDRHGGVSSRAYTVRAPVVDKTDDLRNLSIIAHIDHGKSTLADRLLQMTGTLPQSSSPQFLDKLKVERERGITVKAQTVSIIHAHTDGKKYLINLIDTPGHVDFSYEVSRSLGACEGGLLLVDCTQGIQAQTLSVFHHALDANLTLLPVINKVDLPHASPADTSEQIESSLGLTRDTHMQISAKSGMGVGEVLRQIVEGLPAPKQWRVNDGKLRGLVFDTFYDQFRGVVFLVRVFSGSLKKGDKVRFLQVDRKYEILEVGIHNPEEVPVDVLKEGQVGYVVCNMKNSEEAYIGDTVCWADKMVDPLPGFKPMKAMVYAGVFPMDSGDFPKLEEAIERLTLNDRSVSIQRESSVALSQGFRLGFLGTLHMDVFRQRLEDEYASNVIVTAPTVPYKVVFRDGKEVFISNPADFPDTMDPKARVAHVEEPMVNATIFVPNDYLGEMMELCSRYRGIQQEYRVLDGTDRAILRYLLPLSEIVTGFFSELKSTSSGFASFDYEEAEYETSDLVKLNMMLNSKPVDALAMIVHRSVAQSVGRTWTKKLKDVLPRQLFEVAIQASIGSKVLARETLSAVRKDVTAGLYGGHYERKMKHLNKQKEGKKRLKRLAGNIDIPQSAFFEVLSSRPRTFSTSARQFSASYSLSSILDDDPLLLHLPPAPPIAQGQGARRTYPPILPTVPPKDRASILSNVIRLSTTPEPLGLDDSEALHKAFTDLYLVSPDEHPFTTRELADIIHKMRRERGPARRQASERIIAVADELREIVPKPAQAPKRVLGSLSPATWAANYRRKPTLADVGSAEERFAKLFSSETMQELKARGDFAMWRRGVNHLLYMSARAEDEKRFEKWWNRMSALGLEADSWAILARMILMHRTGRSEGMTIVLNAYLRKVEPDAAIVLINYALFSLATVGQWNAVASAYTRLRPGQPLFPAHKDDLIDVPDGLEPSAITFSLLVHSLAHSGNLQGALTGMKYMLDDGHVPGIPEHLALFEGFAKYGEVPPIPAGRAGDAFPRIEVFPRRWSGERVRITSIWERGRSIFQHKEAEANPWTLEALESVWESFLSLRPSRKGWDTQIPTANAVWTALMAWSRVTNGHETAVRDAWRRMEEKFGVKDEDGWEGLRMDTRLLAVRRMLDELEGEYKVDSD